MLMTIGSVEFILRKGLLVALSEEKVMWHDQVVTDLKCSIYAWSHKGNGKQDDLCAKRAGFPSCKWENYPLPTSTGSGFIEIYQKGEDFGKLWISGVGPSC